MRVFNCLLLTVQNGMFRISLSFDPVTCTRYKIIQISRDMLIHFPHFVYDDESSMVLQKLVLLCLDYIGN